MAHRTSFIIGLAAALCAAPCISAEEAEDVKIEALPVASGVHMLTGQGGNMGVSVGEDGVLLIDDQFAPLTARIKAAVAKLGGGEIRFVINTHWHGDHTGGNENLGKAGTLIVAHDNVRRRMSVEQFMEFFDRKVPASPKSALPVVTFPESVTFHLNGESIRVVHVAAAHTDGDSIVHFPASNVIHAGDVFFNGLYPFVDLDSGGSIDGLIAAVEWMLENSNESTRIIPGHGPLTDLEGLEIYRELLVTVRDRIARLIRSGKTLEEVLEAAPSAEYDEAWGQTFITPEQWVTTVYKSLAP